MGWATGYIEKLRGGETVSFRPKETRWLVRSNRANSVLWLLCSRIPSESGTSCCAKSTGENIPAFDQGDSGTAIQIGNNRGRINGWVTASAIFGSVFELKCEAGQTCGSNTANSGTRSTRDGSSI